MTTAAATYDLHALRELLDLRRQLPAIPLPPDRRRQHRRRLDRAIVNLVSRMEETHMPTKQQHLLAIGEAAIALRRAQRAADPYVVRQILPNGRGADARAAQAAEGDCARVLDALVADFEQADAE